MNSNSQLPIPDSGFPRSRTRAPWELEVGNWELGIGAWLILMALGGVAYAAHHSLAGMYDQSRRVALDGIVAQFHYVNPHPYVVLDVKDASGRTQQWRLEMDNRRELADIGITSETLKQGDRLVVSGSPGRAEPRLLYVWKLDRPADGLDYEQIGGTPRIRIRSR
jgi:uncharacterized protein DUF6152